MFHVSRPIVFIESQSRRLGGVILTPFLVLKRQQQFSFLFYVWHTRFLYAEHLYDIFSFTKVPTKLEELVSQSKDVGQLLSLSGEDAGGVIDDVKDATVAPGICAICGQLEPPGFNAESDDVSCPL